MRLDLKNLLRIFGAIFLASLCIGCAVRAYKVPTAAMSPALNPGDGAIGDHISLKLGAEIERFDILVFKAPMHEQFGSTPEAEMIFVFRVVGLPGETIEIKDETVFINDVKLEEPFQRVSGGKDFPKFTIPADEYFFLGDNRPESWDSRFWTPNTIKKADIRGRIVKIMPGQYKDQMGN